MSLTESAYAPDLRSVLPDLQHEDADDEIVADLARALRGPAEKCLVASGDFSATFAGQPHSAGISPAEWNLSDQVALAQMHAVCALAGCDISVAHTGGCTPLELERLGLGEASPAVLGNADNTTERMIACLEMLRGEFRFNGYVHAKVIPGTSPELVDRLGRLADRLSVN